MSGSKVIMERVIAGVAVFVAFVVMASIFAPGSSQAGSHDHDHHGHADHGHADHGHADHGQQGHSQSDHDHHHGATGDHDAHHEHHQDGEHASPSAHLHSTDAHEGLLSVGSLETSCYWVEIYSTSQGARYTVYDQIAGTELGTLLSVDQISRWFPDLPLKELDGSVEGVLMLAEPRGF